MLESAGLQPLQETTYLALLEAGRSTVTEMASATDRALSDTRETLEQLQTLGFAGVLLDGRYAAVPPQEAVEALVERRLEEFAEARRAAEQLALRFPPPPEEAAHDAAQVVLGREAVEAQFIQLTRGCADELLVFDRPPYAQRPAAANTTETNALARGVRVRGLYAPEAFELPGAMDQARAAVRAGEEARVHADIPVKLAIADRRTAMLAMDGDEPGTTALVVGSSPVVAALVRLFELLWEQGTDLNPDETLDSGGATVHDHRLVALLAAGLKDESIARDLGISTRTVGRRVSALLEGLAVRTRFQAGLRIAQLRAAAGDD